MFNGDSGYNGSSNYGIKEALSPIWWIFPVHVFHMDTIQRPHLR